MTASAEGEGCDDATCECAKKNAGHEARRSPTGRWGRRAL